MICLTAMAAFLLRAATSNDGVPEHPAMTVLGNIISWGIYKINSVHHLQNCKFANMHYELMTSVLEFQTNVVNVSCYISIYKTFQANFGDPLQRWFVLCSEGKFVLDDRSGSPCLFQFDRTDVTDDAKLFSDASITLLYIRNCLVNFSR